MGSGSGSLVTLDFGAGYHRVMQALATVLADSSGRRDSMVLSRREAVVCKRRSAGPCRGMQACRAVDWLGIAPPTVQVPGRWQLNGRRWLGTETKSTRLAEHMQCSCREKRNTQYSPDIESSRPHSSTRTEPGCCTHSNLCPAHHQLLAPARRPRHQLIPYLSKCERPTSSPSRLSELLAPSRSNNSRLRLHSLPHSPEQPVVPSPLCPSSQAPSQRYCCINSLTIAFCTVFLVDRPTRNSYSTNCRSTTASSPDRHREPTPACLHPSI